MGIYFVFLVVTILLNSAVSAQNRIVGGYIAPPSFGSFHASLQNVDGSHVCGGAIVSKTHIVTAAHCVQGTESKHIKAVIGTTNLRIGGFNYDVTDIKIHPHFNFTLRTNDLAVLKVKGLFAPNFVRELKLTATELTEDDDVILTGFGAQKANDNVSTVMYALGLKVFNQETCKYAMRYSRNVTDSMFCTFSKIGEGTCHGDSGGPLIKDDQLVGVVSWGIPCAVGYPDVHTRISSFVDWIESQIRDL